MSKYPKPRTISFHDLSVALQTGAHHFAQSKLLSVVYSTLFSFIGVVLYIVIEVEKIAPMSHSLAAGFMLVGPTLLIGFFNISDSIDQGRKPGISDILKGIRQTPLGLWGISLLCIFLFFIWITEAATVYAFVIGPEPIGFMGLVAPDDKVTSFLIFTSLGGLVITFIVFACSAFSVPLLVYTDTNMVSAVVASVRAIFRNFLVMMTWALLLVFLIMGAAWLLPLLPLTLPIAAYASLALYRSVFRNTK